MTTTILPDRLKLVDTLPLLSGSHPSFDNGACAMEMVAFLAGEPHSDSPTCACPVVAAFVRRLNDGIKGDERRTELLRPVLARLVGSRSTRDVERRRGWLAADWALRHAVPLMLDLHPELATHAAALRACDQVVDKATAEAARLRAGEARSAAAALRQAKRQELRAWVEAENKVTFSFLEQIPQRSAIRARLTELWDYEKVSPPRRDRVSWRRGRAAERVLLLECVRAAG